MSHSSVDTPNSSTDKQRARRQVSGAFLGLALGVVVVMCVALLVKIYDLSDATRETQKGNTSTVDLLKDCTVEGGDCYTKQQARTEEAVGNIGLTSIYASVCAVVENRTHPDASPLQLAKRVRTCVEAVYAEEEAKSAD